MSAAPASIRVLVVDDHPLLRDGVVSIIRSQSDMIVVGEAGNGAEAIEMHGVLNPDVTLMDLQMPELGGVAAIEAIRRTSPDARIIVLTTYSADVRALQALRAGATGYLLKSAIRKELLDCIRAVSRGERYLPFDVAREIALNAIGDPLSAREVEVLALVAEGNLNKQIAYKLSIAEDTVKTHLKSIFTKLGVADRTHAVTVAAKRGFIDL